jgi:hypothetical protein
METVLGVILLVWLALTLGFLAGCGWAGRNRSGVRERETDGFAPTELASPDVERVTSQIRSLGQRLHCAHEADVFATVIENAARRERIWREIQDGVAVERLLRSL